MIRRSYSSEAASPRSSTNTEGREQVPCVVRFFLQSHHAQLNIAVRNLEGAIRVRADVTPVPQDKPRICAVRLAKDGDARSLLGFALHRLDRFPYPSHVVLLSSDVPAHIEEPGGRELVRD